MSKGERKALENQEKEDIWTRWNRNLWGWYKSNGNRVTIPPQVISKFPADTEFRWGVVKNRDEVMVAVDKGFFDHGNVLIGEPRTLEVK